MSLHLFSDRQKGPIFVEALEYHHEEHGVETQEVELRSWAIHTRWAPNSCKWSYKPL